MSKLKISRAFPAERFDTFRVEMEQLMKMSFTFDGENGKRFIVCNKKTRKKVGKEIGVAMVSNCQALKNIHHIFIVTKK